MKQTGDDLFGARVRKADPALALALDVDEEERHGGPARGQGERTERTWSVAGCPRRESRESKHNPAEEERCYGQVDADGGRTNERKRARSRSTRRVLGRERRPRRAPLASSGRLRGRRPAAIPSHLPVHAPVGRLPRAPGAQPGIVGRERSNVERPDFLAPPLRGVHGGVPWEPRKPSPLGVLVGRGRRVGPPRQPALSTSGSSRRRSDREEWRQTRFGKERGRPRRGGHVGGGGRIDGAERSRQDGLHPVDVRPSRVCREDPGAEPEVHCRAARRGDQRCSSIAVVNQ